LISITKENEPNNYQVTIKNRVWCNAIEEELNALEKNETWAIVPLPKEKDCRT
jgi:hypothetical protein